MYVPPRAAAPALEPGLAVPGTCGNTHMDTSVVESNTCLHMLRTLQTPYTQARSAIFKNGNIGMV